MDNVRFEFGKNWEDYSANINRKAVASAERSLRQWIPLDDLSGKKFLDIGSGSGLFSLAAWLWGGVEVYSFDYDENSVRCTKKIKDSVPMEEGRRWTVEQGDVLDSSYMKNFYGKYDVVYSWGVLHHTGNMKKALAEAGNCVAPGGYLFISIYNDQGLKSRMWGWIKKRYNLASERQRKIILFLASLYLHGYKGTFIVYSSTGKKSNLDRGMNLWNDLVDWVGGYPFEYATIDKIVSFYLKRGFKLVRMKALDKKAIGCNQFVFEKSV